MKECSHLRYSPQEESQGKNCLTCTHLLKPESGEPSSSSITGISLLGPEQDGKRWNVGVGGRPSTCRSLAVQPQTAACLRPHQCCTAEGVMARRTQQ